MDKFKQALELMEKMSEEELNNIIEVEKKKICICKTCSNFEQCMDDNEEGFFCVLGKSKCQVRDLKCICNECPAYMNFELKFDAYCSKGSEIDQRNH
jgi:hypothetical protein